MWASFPPGPVVTGGAGRRFAGKLLAARAMTGRTAPVLETELDKDIRLKQIVSSSSRGDEWRPGEEEEKKKVGKL
jgi:hypothetical protein